MTFTRINVAVQPPKEIQTYALQLSRNIAQKTDAYFILDGKNFYPHATIYSTEYPDKNINLVLEQVAAMVKNTSPFHISLEEVSTHKGYIDFQFHKTEAWTQIHAAVIHALNPLRENHLRKKYTEPKELATYTQEQQEYIKQYGYAEVFNAFRPHITLSRIKDESSADSIIKNLAIKPFEFEVHSITAYSMGDHGTCTGIIKEFPLHFSSNN